MLWMGSWTSRPPGITFNLSIREEEQKPANGSNLPLQTCSNPYCQRALVPKMRHLHISTLKHGSWVFLWELQVSMKSPKVWISFWIWFLIVNLKKNGSVFKECRLLSWKHERRMRMIDQDCFEGRFLSCCPKMWLEVVGSGRCFGEALLFSGL